MEMTTPDGMQGARGWLFNCAMTLLARRGRDALVTSLDMSEGDGTHELPAELREVETPESLCLSNDMRNIVSRAINVLPETHRAAIILREIDCLTYQEIANVMAIPSGAARSRLSSQAACTDLDRSLNPWSRNAGKLESFNLRLTWF